jgi:hypothetical protein
MRRTASVLGSALVTLALAGSPAWASPPAQSTENSTGAAQVGPVGVDAPVRIASDGDNQGAAQATGGSQSVDDSTGTAQVGPAEANAPVRVLSDGDDNVGGAGGDGRGGGPPPGDTLDEGPTDRPRGPTEDRIDGAQPPGEVAGAGDRLVSVSTPSEGGPATATPSAGRDELPFTGLTVWLLLVIGVWALGSGLCLQRLLGREEVRIRSL